MLAPIAAPIPLSQLKHDQEPDKKRPRLDHDKKGWVYVASEFLSLVFIFTHPKSEFLSFLLIRLDHTNRYHIIRQRIDRILDQSTEKSDASKDIRGLSNDLPAEKVAQLRTRVKKNLKNKPIDDDR